MKKKPTIIRQLKIGETIIIRAKDFANKVKPKSEVSVQFGVNQETEMIYEGHINKKTFIFTATD